MRSPRRPASETTVTMRPQPAPTMSPTYAWVTCNTAPRLSRMSASQSSGLVSTNFFRVKPDVGMPALFTRMSTGPALGDGAVDRRTHRLLRVLEQLFCFGRIDPTASDDLGTGHDLPHLGVDGDDHDDHAFLGEGAPVAQHAVADVADDPVDVHV